MQGHFIAIAQQRRPNQDVYLGAGENAKYQIRFLVVQDNGVEHDQDLPYPWITCLRIPRRLRTCCQGLSACAGEGRGLQHWRAWCGSTPFLTQTWCYRSSRPHSGPVIRSNGNGSGSCTSTEHARLEVVAASISQQRRFVFTARQARSLVMMCRKSPEIVRTSDPSHRTTRRWIITRSVRS